MGFRTWLCACCLVSATSAFMRWVIMSCGLTVPGVHAPSFPSAAEGWLSKMCVPLIAIEWRITSLSE